MKDEMKRTEQEATDLRGRGWRDRYEGPDGKERVALRRKARRKLKRTVGGDDAAKAKCQFCNDTGYLYEGQRLAGIFCPCGDEIRADDARCGNCYAGRHLVDCECRGCRAIDLRARVAILEAALRDLSNHFVAHHKCPATGGCYDCDAIARADAALLPGGDDAGKEGT